MLLGSVHGSSGPHKTARKAEREKSWFPPIDRLSGRSRSARTPGKLDCVSSPCCSFRWGAYLVFRALWRRSPLSRPRLVPALEVQFAVVVGPCIARCHVCLARCHVYLWVNDWLCRAHEIPLSAASALNGDGKHSGHIAPERRTPCRIRLSCLCVCTTKALTLDAAVVEEAAEATAETVEAAVETSVEAAAEPTTAATTVLTDGNYRTAVPRSPLDFPLPFPT